jgi:hypothetical protein
MMVRQIKFRAWNKRNEYMDYGPEFSIAGSKRYGDDEDIPINDAFFNGGRPYDKADFVFEQFTGLQDCEGRDIYEGDIAEYINIEDKKLVGRIIFNHGAYEISFKRAPGMFLPFCTMCNFKVIGNIHENPELLEVSR